MFTSPHLVDFEERIRMNGAMIPKADVERLGNLLLTTEFELTPTMFDYCMVMAVLYFKEQKCDIMVMETGIGGRFDSTNALGTPEVSVITKIGFDHTAILGNTLKEIAWEKAGIIKKGTPVVTQRQEPEADEVLRQVFIEVNSCELLRTQSQDYKSQQVGCSTKEVTNINETAKFIQVRESDLKETMQLEMKMKGTFQIENATTAILAARLLFRQGSDTEIESFIKRGIAETFWKGRMEIMSESPFLMVDGAHNGHGVLALAEGLKNLYPNEKFHFIMGVMADKDYENMIEELLPIAIDFTTVTPESSRALQAKELAECISAKGVPAYSGESIEAVLGPFLQDSSIKETNGNKTVAFGSLYFIGEIEDMFCRKNTLKLC